MSLTPSYDTEPAAGIFCCFDCSRASLAMHTDAASLSDFVTLLQSACLCAWAQLWMDRVHALQHFIQKMSKHIAYAYSPNKRSAEAFSLAFRSRE